MSAQDSVNIIQREIDSLKSTGAIDDHLYGQFRELLNKVNSSSPVLEYVEAIYPFAAQQDGDLSLQPGDKIQVLEKISPDWYKGKCDGKVGVFPSNYVKPAFSGSSASRSAAATPAAAPQYSGSSQQPFPPQFTGCYQQPQQPVVVQQPVVQPVAQPAAQPAPQEHHHSALKKFGSSLGNAAIFGAGATMGSDLVNSIF